MPGRSRLACVYPVRLGRGGLALQSVNAIAALANTRVDLCAIGPRVLEWPRTTPRPQATWQTLTPPIPMWRTWPWLRSFSGVAQLSHDVHLGRLAAAQLDRIKPDILYAFTQVAFEVLSWARAHRVPTVLDSPNGHIRHFQRVYLDEHAAWCSGPYRGHPSAAMVERVEQEYELADRIRVSSQWAKSSLVSGGVPAKKITVLPQPVDTRRYRPGNSPEPPTGPLRVVFVGTLDLRKGFVYLLDAARALQGRVSVELVGGTVDRCTRKLLAAHGTGLILAARPGDPIHAYHRAELAVLPTLEDGFGFAAAEAMSCGLPIVTTDACGAHEWVESGQTGWVVPARSVEALAHVFNEALTQRLELPAMGLRARAVAQSRGDFTLCDRALADWVLT